MGTIKKCCGGEFGSEPESDEVMRRLEAHRNYWKPKKVKVILLAESHVYTTTSELDRHIATPIKEHENLPLDFVRLVYCLGYGENDLLNKSIVSPRNSGTPQFWKIFLSCTREVKRKEDFAPVLKTGTPSMTKRVNDKLWILNRLKDLGVWLLDASQMPLYYPQKEKPSPACVECFIQAGWDDCVGEQIAKAKPGKIICIGKGVARALRERLNADYQGRWIELRQPNAHLSSEEHLCEFQRYYPIVKEANGGKVPSATPPWEKHNS